MLKLIWKIVKRLIVLGIVVGIFVVAINIYVVQSTKNAISTFEEIEKIEAVTLKSDAIIVLGAFVREDGQLSLMLKERLDTAIALYKAGFSERLLMSGDHGREEYDEVRAMKNYAIEQGVPSEDIFMDHAGFSTYETMYRAKAIFEVETAFIVTQEYHLPRAIYDARVQGIDARGVICDKKQYVGATYRLAREVLARNKDFVYGIVKPKPTYLGEAIPITGSGDVTND